jgi:hypothetical protein
MTATLKVTRNWRAAKWNVVGRHPAEVVLDGTVVASIEAGETAEVSVGDGRHTLRMTSGRRMSPERTFDATDGQTICFISHGPVGPIFLASFVKPELAIVLKRQ